MMQKAWIEPALALFRQACELPGDQRIAFLERETGDDAQLRGHVEAMLAEDDAEEVAIDLPLVPHGIRAALSDLAREGKPVATGAIPETIGGYRIVRLIAHGGMGVVYEAEQDNPRRRVAIKVARTSGAATERIRRFELEAQLLARLSHPGIAQIIEAGTTSADAGATPFFVMEFVEGQPLTAYAKAHLSTARDKLQLMVRVCEAVGFAHGQGVVHRDLKPDNVLVDAAGQPKVLDFGVAKVEAAGGFGAATMRTEAGRVIGTLGYMAPEQLGGKSEGLGPEADVYSLGVMIYELLSGRLPHELDGVTLSRALAVVTTTDAPLLGVIRPEHRGDIEAVVAKALEKDHRYRYANAAALQADLERHLRGEPIVARPAGPLRKVAKWARRNPALAASVFGLFLALSTGTAVLLAKNQEVLAKNREFELVADSKRLERAIARADELVPARLEMVEGIEKWLREYGRLADAALLDEKRSTLESIRNRAQAHEGESWTFEDDLVLQLEHDVLAKLVVDLELFGLDTLTDYRSTLEDLRERAQARVGENWIFDDARLQLKHDVLAELVTDPEFGKNAGLAKRMEERLETSRNIEHRTVGEWKVEWKDAIERVQRNEKYQPRPFVIAEQIGLIPLGPDPVSGLEEFLHFQTHEGDIPPRDVNGRFPVTDDTGIILVLIPGGIGTFWMGEENAVDTRERPRPMPPPDPFFLSKYEMTRGQWYRLTGTNPSARQRPRDRPVNPKRPVNLVSWEDCDKMMRRLGLILPDEVQWGYAARAGTTTVFWTGQDASSMKGKENVFDRYDSEFWHKNQWFRWDVQPAPWYDEAKQRRRENGSDGALAPVGSYQPNAFGLYDVAGNLAEWCAKGPGAVQDPPASRGDLIKVLRGSSFKRGVKEARSASRRDALSNVFFNEIGLRPAMEIQR